MNFWKSLGEMFFGSSLTEEDYEVLSENSAEVSNAIRAKQELEKGDDDGEIQDDCGDS